MTTSSEESEESIKLDRSESPHLRLFLSADIVGSTAFKQKAGQETDKETGFPRWFQIVLQFYQRAELGLARHWQSISSGTPQTGQDLFGEAPELWKTIGDEVLFCKRVDHPWQAVVCMHAWISTLAELRAFLTENTLNVKSTAWLADFPLRNNEIVLSKSANKALALSDDSYVLNNQESLRNYYNDPKAQDYVRDFIGPSIDTGFRLTAFASIRKLALSVELAFLLGSEQERTERNTYIYATKTHYVLPPFHFKYEGRHSLKGVVNGNPYPVFWIDLDPNNALFVAEDQVLNTAKPSALQVKELAKAFINSEPDLLSLPYIPQCAVPGYDDNTHQLLELLERRHRYVEGKKAWLANEKADLLKVEGGEEKDPPLHLEVRLTAPRPRPDSSVDWEKLVQLAATFSRAPTNVPKNVKSAGSTSSNDKDEPPLNE